MRNERCLASTEYQRGETGIKLGLLENFYHSIHSGAYLGASGCYLLPSSCSRGLRVAFQSLEQTSSGCGYHVNEPN